MLLVLLCITLSSPTLQAQWAWHDLWPCCLVVWDEFLINPERMGKTDTSCFTMHVGQAVQAREGRSAKPFWIPDASHLTQQWWPELHRYSWDTDTGMNAQHNRPVESRCTLIFQGNELIQKQLRIIRKPDLCQWLPSLWLYFYFSLLVLFSMCFLSCFVWAVLFCQQAKQQIRQSKQVFFEIYLHQQTLALLPDSTKIFLIPLDILKIIWIMFDSSKITEIGWFDQVEEQI